MSLFFRLLGEEEKGAALAEAVRSVVVGEPDARVFEVAPESFVQVPGAPFFWSSALMVVSLLIAVPSLKRIRPAAEG